jgi:hypothetical protein
MAGWEKAMITKRPAIVVVLFEMAIFAMVVGWFAIVSGHITVVPQRGGVVHTVPGASDNWPFLTRHRNQFV